jgi:Ca2+-binding RTX toxin-like protein
MGLGELKEVAASERLHLNAFPANNGKKFRERVLPPRNPCIIWKVRRFWGLNNMLITGTKQIDVLDISFGDTVKALGGNDTIKVDEAFAYGVTPVVYGEIDGGTGVDTLVLNAPQTPFPDGSNYWLYKFSSLLSIEKIVFGSGEFFEGDVGLNGTFSPTATGTVSVGKAMQLVGSAGYDYLNYTVVGGMHAASALTLPKLTFTNFDSHAIYFQQFARDGVEFVAGDANDYVLKASDYLGRLGIEQDLYGNVGNDQLIGSVGDDFLAGGSGADKVYGNAGDDMFGMGPDGQPQAGDLFDGGAGTDFLRVYGGAVTFAGTLVSIEGVSIRGTSSISFKASQMAALPAALKIAGLDTGALYITDATKFSAAKFAFVTADTTAPGIHGSPHVSIFGTAGADVITGSSSGDTLHGLGGADRLNGGGGGDVLFGDGGADVLTGGQGSDTFAFENVTAPVARDTIADFKSAEGDKIQLALDGFAGLGVAGPLADGAFYAAAGAKTAHDADDRIIYNTTAGTLAYDADGLGGTAGVIFAVLSGHPALTAADIIVI